MPSHVFPRSLTVTLRDVDNNDAISERTIVLESPDWEVDIGRGTLNGADHLRPGATNAWFDTRVMSRHHAVLRADPYTKVITIQDVGSMHGTHLAGRRLKANAAETLFPGDIITMGADVTRGSNCFSALRVVIDWHWSDPSGVPGHFPISPFAHMTHNTFSADYDEHEYQEGLSSPMYDDEIEDEIDYETHHHMEEAASDGEAEVVQDSIRQARVESMVPQSRTFAVPESDVSEPSSWSSDGKGSDVDSPTSSPVGPSEKTEDKSRATSKASVFESAIASTEVQSTALFHATSPTLFATTNTSSEHGPRYLASLMNVSNDDGYHGDGIEQSDHSDQSDHSRDLSYPLPPTHPEYSTSLFVESCESSSHRSNSNISSTPQKEAVRAPSPSHAALAKPSMEPLPAPPFIQESQPKGIADDASSGQARSSNAWAGHNYVLYEPMPPRFIHDALGPAHVTSTISYAPAPVPVPQSLNNMVWLPQYPADPRDHMSKIPAPAFPDQQHREDSLGPSNATLKRKADQMTSDTTLHFETAIPDLDKSDFADSAATAVHDKDLAGTTNNAATDLQIVVESGAKAREDTPLQEAELPPRKKVKKSKNESGERSDDAGGSLMKLAAATVAGMAIGTIGTIVGLAALPPDYFI